MENIDINSINRVIELAREYRIDYEKNGVKEFLLSIMEFDLDSILNQTQQEKDLYEYLMNTEFETVKDIMTIMYLGMERNYNQNDIPEDIYYKQRSLFDEEGWEGKSRVVDQITSRVPLDEYLIDGLKILRLR